MQYLYRAFDSEGKLLYVGISGRWSERLHQHEKTSDWMKLTDYVSIERFPDRESVEEAERLAVMNEEPAYNKQYSTSFVHPRNHWADVKRWIKSGVADDSWHQMVVDSVRRDALTYEKKAYQLRPSGMALLFLDLIGWLNYHGSPVCRNCDGIHSSNLLKNHYEAGEDQLLEGVHEHGID